MSKVSWTAFLSGCALFPPKNLQASSAFLSTPFLISCSQVKKSVQTPARNVIKAIESPFAQEGKKESPVANVEPSTGSRTILPLSEENVESVLDELRPYLISDGGNVSIHHIDGATVFLQLEGACGSCPSSMMTMKMGIEKKLFERIPEIEQVVQVQPEGPKANEENVEKVLDEVRPFLNVAGGTINLVEITGIDGIAPTVRLKMTGTGAAIMSVKVEIAQRIRRNFPTIANVTFD